jgi:hypothetical protein
MGRIQSAAVLERKAALAKARETYYKNKTVTTENVTKTVQKRAMDAYVYSSYMLADSTGASERMLVQASAVSVTKFGGATSLLLVDPASITTTIGKKPKTFTPAQVHAMSTSGTPTASASRWGTRVIKYSGATAGTSQAHFVAPISGDLNATFAEVSARAKTVYNAIKGSLGSDDYHRFWFSPEFMNVQEN